MQIIDFHSHILPGIDDGARNVHTSLSMLDMVAAQQVDVMIATPHFYASRDRISTFLERRDKAWQSLQRELTGDSVRYPQIIAGAEVAFFDGISKAKEIGLLTIQGTDILLLEMPFQPWTSKQIDEVAFLVRDRGFTVLIAHLERFLWMPGNKKQVEKLFEAGSLNELYNIIEENLCIYEENIATDDKQIRKDIALVKSYIKAHLSEKINLESLADMVFLSPGYLSLIFKQSTGDTVSHYIISQRIDEAKRLLETTNMKVNQICEKVGIDNVSYFGQQFKMICGMSPSEYRKRKKFGG